MSLLRHQEIQQRLQAEVDEAYEKGGTDKHGRLSYGVVQNLEYLDMVINETLRMYPAAATIMNRKCTRDYTIPGTNLTIKKGQEVEVPVMGIHMDARYYPDPEKFDPERFSKEAKAARHPMAFLSFGQGPRMCIGSRFALLEMKVALAKVMREFDVKSCSTTPTAIELDPGARTYTAKNPLTVKVERRSWHFRKL
jgi:cytochrome P450 family 6